MSSLMEVVKKGWTFDTQKYPALAGLTDQARKEFALRHILLHQQEAVGRFARLLERADHRVPLDTDEMRHVTGSFFVNTLRLAALVGVTAEHLTLAVQSRVTPKHTAG